MIPSLGPHDNKQAFTPPILYIKNWILALQKGTTHNRQQDPKITTLSIKQPTVDPAHHYEMATNGARDEYAGPESGPEAPFPIRLQGPVIKGFGRGSKEVSLLLIDFSMRGVQNGEGLLG